MLSESEDIVRELERRRKRRERLRRRQEEVGAGRGRAGLDGCGSGPRRSRRAPVMRGPRPRGEDLRSGALSSCCGGCDGRTDGSAFPGVPLSLGAAPCCARPRLIALRRPCFLQLPTSSEMPLVF